jgi:menaquinone-dependent protoporphyrinogen oxidase
MRVLVAYASKHGSTREIADRVAGVLRAGGADAEAMPVGAAVDPSGYDAFVVGSAVYYDSWMKEAVRFVRAHRVRLASRPLWLFSSGPIGRSRTDGDGRDLRDVSVPKEIAGFRAALRPRDHRVFFGVLDRRRFTLVERLLWVLPAGGELFRDGDFRDWADVDGWAARIARELAPAGPAGVA